MISTLLLSLALAFQPSARTPVPASTPSPVAELRRLDQRVASVGFRLATRAAAAGLCPVQDWETGFAIHHLSQYGRAAQAQAVRDFGLGAAPAVLALATGSPAARAGLRTDDAILAADGTPLPQTPAGAQATFAPTEAMLTVLDTAFADGTAQLTVRRAGRTLTLDISAVRGCATRFQVVPSGTLNAHADGRYVQINSAGAAFAASDDALAAALAHELAHNILRHRARLDAAGVERGLLQHFGRSARLFRQTELEADRYSMYLLDAAGFSLTQALDYWERFARAETNPLPTTHPAWATRLAAMRAEAAEIAQAKAGGRRPRPPALDLPLN